jgi:hypothetical protein
MTQGILDAIAMAQRATGLHFEHTIAPSVFAVSGETLTSGIQCVLVDVAYRAKEPWRALWEVQLDPYTGEPTRIFLACD